MRNAGFKVGDKVVVLERASSHFERQVGVVSSLHGDAGMYVCMGEMYRLDENGNRMGKPDKFNVLFWNDEVELAEPAEMADGPDEEYMERVR